jgi:hypothetical protein
VAVATPLNVRSAPVAPASNVLALVAVVAVPVTSPVTSPVMFPENDVAVTTPVTLTPVLNVEKPVTSTPLAGKYQCPTHPCW